MGKISYTKLEGSQNLRQRLLLSTLSSKPIIVENIRGDENPPGLRSHEVSLLRLIERISDQCAVEINETGTKLRYKPGILIGGKNHVHDCGLSRSIGYFLEPLLILGLFGKSPLSIRLQGITNDPKDPCVDTFRHTTLHILEHFGVPKERLQLKIESRGSPPLGGGLIILGVPNLANGLSAVTWVDEGRVKRIRGITFTTKVSSDFDHRMMYAARGVINRFLPDVRIEKDHRTQQYAGRSKGYGMSLVAETDKDCFISADTAVCHPQADEMSGFEDADEKPNLMTPEDVGVQVASMLLGEIEQLGVVDSTHQGLLFLLCALCPEDISKIRVGKLTTYGIETLRTIRDFLGVIFVIKPDPATNTIILKCRGCGMKNLSRKIS